MPIQTVAPSALGLRQNTQHSTPLISVSQLAFLEGSAALHYCALLVAD